MEECSRVHTQRVGVQPLSSVAVSRYWTRKGLGFNLSHDAPGNIALQARVSACRGQVFINARARRSCRRRTDLGQKDIPAKNSSMSKTSTHVVSFSFKNCDNSTRSVLPVLRNSEKDPMPFSRQNWPRRQFKIQRGKYFQNWSIARSGSHCRLHCVACGKKQTTF